MSVGDAFEHLPAADVDRLPWEFDVLEIGAGHGLARLRDGSPLLLVRTTNRDPLVNFHLAHMVARGELLATLRFPDGHAEQTPAASVQVSGDLELRMAFIDMLTSAPILDHRTVTGKELHSWLTTLSELFAALQRPARTSVVGLWGELTTMAASKHPTTLASFWHSITDAPIDFSDGAGTGFEVKTSTRLHFSHQFALNQLRGSGTRIYIVSLRTYEDGTGESIREVIESLELPVAQEEAVKRGVISTLGANWQEGIGIRFSTKAALDSARIFDAQDVPAIDPNCVPAGVEEVHFTVDLSAVSPLFEGKGAIQRACDAVGWLD